MSESEKVTKFIKDCKISHSDWVVYLDRGTVNEIIHNLIITYNEQTKHNSSNNT